VKRHLGEHKVRCRSSLISPWAVKEEPLIRTTLDLEKESYLIEPQRAIGEELSQTKGDSKEHEHP
jgi:hypothetical protein